MNDERGGRLFRAVSFPLKLFTWSRNDRIGSNDFEPVAWQNLPHWRLGAHSRLSIRDARKELSQRIRGSGPRGTIRRALMVFLVSPCRACQTIGLLRSYSPRERAMSCHEDEGRRVP